MKYISKFGEISGDGLLNIPCILFANPANNKKYIYLN